MSLFGRIFGKGSNPKDEPLLPFGETSDYDEEEDINERPIVEIKCARCGASGAYWTDTDVCDDCDRATNWPNDIVKWY